MSPVKKVSSLAQAATVSLKWLSTGCLVAVLFYTLRRKENIAGHVFHERDTYRVSLSENRPSKCSDGRFGVPDNKQAMLGGTACCHMHVVSR